MKRVILAGGSGFVGQALASVLVASDYEVVVLGRGESHRKDGVQHLQWDGRTVGGWANSLEGAEAVVNLTGKNINCRHTPENREEIVRSRVDSVRVLGKAIGECATPPAAWVTTAILVTR
jgi:NAD dependent epimerase/dehydratase family enzyme